jgi:hypothetical protein
MQEIVRAYCTFPKASCLTGIVFPRMEIRAIILRRIILVVLNTRISRHYYLDSPFPSTLMFFYCIIFRRELSCDIFMAIAKNFGVFFHRASIVLYAVENCPEHENCPVTEIYPPRFIKLRHVTLRGFFFIGLLFFYKKKKKSCTFLWIGEVLLHEKFSSNSYSSLN